MNDPYEIEQELHEVIDLLLKQKKKKDRDTLKKVESRLKHLRDLYKQQSESFQFDQFEVDRQIRKSRWQKPDKALIPLSFGLAYPWLRKIHQNEKHALLRDRSAIIQDHYTMNHIFLPRIEKYLEIVQDRLLEI